VLDRPGRRLCWVWSGRVISALILAGLAVYLWRQGLDRADKISSAFGLLVALAALVVPYLLPRNKRASKIQSVKNSSVRGSVSQVRDVQGVDVAPAAGRAAPPPVTAATGSQLPKEEGQYIDGVWVGGHVTQVDGSEGGVNLR
jgi:hypothetical protein